MKNIRIKDIIENSNVPAKLIRSTIKQFGGYEDFKEIASDIYNHGIDGGFRGFIYHKDTVAFYRRNKKEIIELLTSQAQEFGEDILTMISNFNCIKDQYTVNEIFTALSRYDEEYIQLYNCLAWFAGEEVVRAYMYLVEEEN